MPSNKPQRRILWKEVIKLALISALPGGILIALARILLK